MFKTLFQKLKISQHHQTQYDAVVPEHRKVMLFDVGHQETDDQDTDNEGDQAAHGKDQQFAAVKYEANLKDVFDQLQQGGADHDGDCQIKGEFRRNAAFQADEQDAKGYLVTAEAFGEGIHMWLRSQGEWVEVIK